MAQVIYTPRENGDPIETKFAGFAFRAGVPTEVPDDATVEAMARKVTGKTAEGEDTTKGFETHRKVVDVLRANPYFSVDNLPAAPKASAGRPRLPKKAEEYRSFAQEWFARVESSKALVDRWESESPLRAKLGISDDSEDITYLNPFFEQRLHELKQAEKASEK